MEEQAVRDAVEEWMDKIVVGLGLCPFAAPVIADKTLRIRVVMEADDELALSAVLEESSRLLESEEDEVSTILIVTPNHYGNFEDYLDAVAELEGVLEEAEADALIQIATFHPHYRFEDVEADDPSNLTNCSPFPLFHLLRQEAVEDALDGWTEPMRIPEKNIRMLREMSPEDRAKLWPKA
jgi:hypothetical protein